MKLLCISTLILAAFHPSFCTAQEWARNMFEVTSHDFGTVARGAKAEYEFIFTNLYQDDVHIASVRASCGCTSPRVEKDMLKSYEKSSVIAHINSDTFLGNQGATITVKIDRPYYAEVQLHVKVYVRTDVVFDPPSVTFGNIDQGIGAEQTVKVTYFGRNDWMIKEIKSQNPNLNATMSELSRSSGRVTYELRVQLSKNAPPGYNQDHLIVVTNDQRSSQIPLSVDGTVQPEIMMSPASLFLGTVKPGDKITKQLVVRGKKPFKILSVSSECDCLQTVMPSDSPAKTVYLIPITFVASGDPRKIIKTIRIKTDNSEVESQIMAYAAVIQ